MQYTILSGLIVSIIFVGVRTHPQKRSQQPYTKALSSPEVAANNSSEHQLPVQRLRKSLPIKSALRTKKSAHNRRARHSDEQIVFPSDSPGRVDAAKIDFSRVTPCENATFCENVPHYPQDLIRHAIQHRDDLKFLSTIDVAPDIGQRIDVDDDETLCASEENVVFPQKGINKDKKWLYVINEDNFQQGVRVETCRKENSACDLIEGSIDGYRTFCKQKFVYRQLASVTENGSIATDSFRFPASCCCHVKFTGNLLTRVGMGAGKTSLQSPVPRATTARVDHRNEQKK